MRNEILAKIKETYKGKSNKELSKILLNLNNDFTILKETLLELTVAIGEVEDVHDKVYAELQARLKFRENE
jgi:hypothetical protein